MKPISEAHNIDCKLYMKTLPDKCIDVAIVDPPYGINAPNMTMGSNMNRKHGGYNGESVAQQLKKGRLNQGSGKLKNRALNTMSCEWDFFPPDKEYFDELFRVSKNQIIWGGNYFNLPPTRGIVIWDKMQPWENFSQVELAWTSFDVPASIIHLSNTGGANKEIKIHPTQKPTPIYHFLMKKFCKAGDKILDTHLGSGSSRITAYKMGFDFYACEIDKDYFDAQEERFRRECFGEIKTDKGILVQASLF
jgi:DNA modification methylase